MRYHIPKVNLNKTLYGALYFCVPYTKINPHIRSFNLMYKILGSSKCQTRISKHPKYLPLSKSNVENRWFKILFTMLSSFHYAVLTHALTNFSVVKIWKSVGDFYCKKSRRIKDRIEHIMYILFLLYLSRRSDKLTSGANGLT